MGEQSKTNRQIRRTMNRSNNPHCSTSRRQLWSVRNRHGYVLELSSLAHMARLVMEGQLDAVPARHELPNAVLALAELPQPQRAPRASPQGAQAGCCLSGASISQQRLGSSEGPIFKGCTGMASGLPGGTWWFFSCELTHTMGDSA